MKIASEAFKDLKVICITEDENGLLDETIALLRAGIVRFVENHVHVSRVGLVIHSLHWRLLVPVSESRKTRLRHQVEASLGDPAKIVEEPGSVGCTP